MIPGSGRSLGDGIGYPLQCSWASLVAQTVKKKICLQCRRPGFDPWMRKISWSRARQPTPVFLPGESRGQRSLAEYSPWGCKESDTTEQLSTAHSTAQRCLQTRERSCFSKCASIAEMGPEVTKQRLVHTLKSAVCI